MTFNPPRKLGLSLGGLWLAILFGAIALGVGRLSAAVISPWIVLWVSLPIIGVPLLCLVGYRIYGLLNARYVLDRDGFYLTWGLASEQIPIGEITRLGTVETFPGRLLPKPGLWWPGCVVGRREVEGMGTVEFFASSGPDRMIVLSLAGHRHLAISPPDREAFHKAFVDISRMGSLEPIRAVSQRPDFFFIRLWNDRLARALVLLGLVTPILLLGFLAFRAPTLPAAVPFGFGPTGVPEPLAPPGRLLLLPLIGVLIWLVDLALGVWYYRRDRDRPLAYVLWTTSLLSGGLLWGAAFHLIAAVDRVGAMGTWFPWM